MSTVQFSSWQYCTMLCFENFYHILEGSKWNRVLLSETIVATLASPCSRILGSEGDWRHAEGRYEARLLV